MQRNEEKTSQLSNTATAEADGTGSRMSFSLLNAKYELLLAQLNSTVDPGMRLSLLEKLVEMQNKIVECDANTIGSRHVLLDETA